MSERLAKNAAKRKCVAQRKKPIGFQQGHRTRHGNQNQISRRLAGDGNQNANRIESATD
jgi:hypothetical protein